MLAWSNAVFKASESLVRVNLVLTVFHLKSSKQRCLSIYFPSFCSEASFFANTLWLPNIVHSLIKPLGQNLSATWVEIETRRQVKGQRWAGVDRVRENTEVRKVKETKVMGRRSQKERRAEEREQGSWETANGDQKDAQERIAKEKHSKKNLRRVGGEISITAQLVYFSSLWNKFC